MINKSKGFTLAETLITLTILGVVAAITVPALINKQIESANRAKVKKAMANYEKALNQMIIDNDIKVDVSALNGNTCETTRPYFKTVENGDNNCQFKTADRIWWDISDIQNPIISLKDKITSTNLATMKTNAESISTDKTTFAMIGYLDTNGILRINDLGVAKDGETIPTAKNKTYLSKLYGFINNSSSSTQELSFEDKFEQYTQNVCGNNYNSKSCVFFETCGCCGFAVVVYDSEGNPFYFIDSTYGENPSNYLGIDGNDDMKKNYQLSKQYDNNLNLDKVDLKDSSGNQIYTFYTDGTGSVIVDKDGNCKYGSYSSSQSICDKLASEGIIE